MFVKKKFQIVILGVILIASGCATQKSNMEELPMGKLADRSIDCRGKIITTYILFKAYTELESMNDGEMLEIITDDSGVFENDISAWCRMTGLELVDIIKENHHHRYLIKKAALKEQGKKISQYGRGDE